MEGNDEWIEGIDLTQLDSFDKLWHNEKVINWRKGLLLNCRQCPKYSI
jgi:hypothetical protein